MFDDWRMFDEKKRRRDEDLVRLENLETLGLKKHSIRSRLF